MKSIRSLTAACALLTAFAASAQTPPGGAAGTRPGPMTPRAASMPGASAADRMAMMDKQMQSMRELHDKMARARTPEERQALMAENAKLMQEGMNMMGGMGPGGMGMGMGMGSTANRQQMMEKRMEMMQSMMQMMMDRMQAQPPAAK